MSLRGAALALLPARLRLWLRERRHRARTRSDGWAYRAQRFGDDETGAGAYKRCLGGGAEQWEQRGRYQLALLRAFGLTAESRVLDVGCGPLRAGVHAIAFLAPGAHAGLDVDPDFVAAAKRTITEFGLADRRPTVLHDTEFGFARAVPAGDVDFVIAFSVLNHCSPAERRAFFEHLERDLQPGVRAVVTHAAWCDATYVDGLPIRVEHLCTTAADLPAGVAPTDWGWKKDDGVLPIVVFTTSG